MNYTKANCSSCNTELMIRIAKGDNAPERVLCKSCSQGKTPQKTTMKLAAALKVAKGSKRVQRTFGKKKWTCFNKFKPTHDEAAQRKRIYGS